MRRFRTVDRQNGIVTRYVQVDPEAGTGMVYYVDGAPNERRRSDDAPMGLYSPADIADRLQHWTVRDGQVIVEGWE